MDRHQIYITSNLCHCSNENSKGKLIYDALEGSIHHIKSQAEMGCKFMPGEEPSGKNQNLKFFFNRVILGDNTVMVVTDKVKTVILKRHSCNRRFYNINMLFS